MGRHGDKVMHGDSFAAFTGPAGVTHQPGLDGLRGLAVGAVVAFHLGFGGVSGGYLGVSFFFTLSGVLIGSLILDEITRTGGFSLRTFWLRRARRLLPPAGITLAVVGVGRLTTARLEGTSGADVVASALDVANWHFVNEGSSYSELFSRPSAVLHFWSLAIEEQFYIAAGLLSLLVASRSRRPVRTIGIAAVVVAAISFAMPFVVGFGVDRVYYGTDTRAGELMVGVALAALIASASRRRTMLSVSPLLAVVAVAALAVTAALWVAVTPGTDSIRNGLLPLTAVLSVLIVVGALMPAGPVATLARLPMLRWVGRISYALYLVHWPVIVVADQFGDDRSILTTLVLVAVSVVLAQLSAVFVERPIRRQRVHRGRLAFAASVALVAIGSASAFAGPTTESADLLGRLSIEDSPDAAVSEASAASPSGLPRIALFGDSVGFSMLLALGGATVEPAFVRAPSDVNLGCGIAVSPAPPTDQPSMCDDPAERFARKAMDGDVDVAVMISCQWELLTQPIPGADDDDQTIGDPEFDGFVRLQYEHVADRLVAAGVDRILWMRCPYLSQVNGVDGLAPRFVSSRDPSRVDALNTIIDDVAADRHDVDVLAFDDWVNQRVDDSTIRPDGSHFEYRSPTAAVDAFIATVNAALTG